MFRNFIASATLLAALSIPSISHAECMFLMKASDGKVHVYDREFEDKAVAIPTCKKAFELVDRTQKAPDGHVFQFCGTVFQDPRSTEAASYIVDVE